MIQNVTIELNDKGFSPAIVIVKAGIPVQWNIEIYISGAEDGTQFLVPKYATQLLIDIDENTLYFLPTEDFDFSTGDNKFYGYVKVVDDFKKVDVAAVKEEVDKFETQIWPLETFQTASGGASCH